MSDFKKKVKYTFVTKYNSINRWMGWFHLPRCWMKPYRTELLLQYIEDVYSDLIEKYKNMPPCTDLIDDNSNIFVMWYQGEEKMPEMLKITFNSIKEHAGTHPVVLITKDNIKDYLSKATLWDPEIFKAVEEKRISFTNLSDLFRMCILYTYGGIWIDASVLVNWDIDKFTHGLNFFSGKLKYRTFSNNPMNWNWTTYFMATPKGNPLMGFVYEVLLTQLKKEKKFIEYFMMDNAILTAYNNIPHIRQMISDYPAMFDKYIPSATFMPKEFDQEEWTDRRTSVPYLKMSYKVEYKEKSENGKPTYMAYILENLKETTMGK